MTRNRIGLALTVAAGLFATSALSRYLLTVDVVGAETSRRIVQIAVGLALAVWANYMPKDLMRPGVSACASSVGRSAVRIGGWAMTLAGLTYAGVWAVAPLAVARPVAMAVVALALVVTVTIGLWTLLRCRPGGRAV